MNYKNFDKFYPFETLAVVVDNSNGKRVSKW